MIRVELEGTGSGNPLAVFAELGDAASSQGLRVCVEDPVGFATGRGRFTIDVPRANNTEDGIAVVRAFLDQLQGDEPEAFRIVSECASRVTTFDAGDCVSVPDGCIGSVIGFYNRADKKVLVLLDSGDKREYTATDLHLVA